MTNVTCKFLFVCSQSLSHFTEVIYMFMKLKHLLAYKRNQQIDKGQEKTGED